MNTRIDVDSSSDLTEILAFLQQIGVEPYAQSSTLGFVCFEYSSIGDLKSRLPAELVSKLHFSEDPQFDLEKETK